LYLEQLLLELDHFVCSKDTSHRFITSHFNSEIIAVIIHELDDRVQELLGSLAALGLNLKLSFRIIPQILVTKG